MTAINNVVASIRIKKPGRSWANGFACFAFLILFFFSFPVFSAPFIDEDTELDVTAFDHLTTGFALDGNHAIIDCEACHVGGVFDALPKDCANCHDGVFAGGVSSTHIPVFDDCSVCHTSVNFLDASAGLMDHSVISAGTPCSGCHDGVTATGKPPNHIPTTAECDLCHNVNTWQISSGAPDHSTFAPNSCFTCHDGITASGKSPSHINTTDNCAACHQPFPASWTPVPPSSVDHNEVLGTCASCHNRITAGGKPSNHIDTTDVCEACHAPGPTPWNLVTGVDHAQVIGSCESCHNNIITQGKPPSHISSTDNCNACHTAIAWIPTTIVDHSQVIGSCISCHNNVVALGKPANHINSTDQCDSCHTVPPDAFAPLAPSAVDHTQVVGTCESCHNGVIARGKGPAHVTTVEPCDVCHTTNSWLVNFDHSTVAGQACNSCHDGLQATGKHPSHINSTDICEACHLNTTSWNPVASANVDHSQVIGTCASCHDGVVASGKSANHINTTDVCEACHQPAPTPWIPVLPSAVDHAHVIGACFTCHDGTTATGKGPTHINTTDFCEACHQPAPTPWIPVISSAVDHNEVLGVCSSCHDGLIATGKGPTHVPTTQECNDCHSTQQWIPAAPDHSQVTPGQCITCHDGVSASGKSANHINSTDVCDACHAIFPATWTPVTAASVDHTQVIGTCSSCHDGVTASGKSVNHINTTDVCDACHAAGPTPWAPAITVDHNEVLGLCSSCHDGFIATGKSVSHIPTTAECDLCHTVTAWIPATGGGGGVPDHSTFAPGSCISCHDGVTASGKSANHITSTDVCDACHLPAPSAWTPVPNSAVDHNEVLGTCSSCHDGVIATGKSTSHIVTVEECDVCHITAAWFPATGGSGGTPDHSTFVGNCINCHNGTAASGKSVNHLNTTDVCDACHAVFPATWAPALSVDHNQVVGNCASCHNGTTASGKSANHINTSDVCDACHQPAPATWIPVANSAVDHAQVIGVCSSCHDGLIATGKSTSHIPTVDECDICHTTTAWIPATGGSGGGVPDHSTFVGNCISCHDGTTASGKSANHILTTDVCDACHAVFPANWAPVTANAVDHAQVIGICSSCHNGTTASGKSPTHINSTNTCDACHAVGPTPWAPAQSVDHGHVIGTCVSCHNGTTASGKSPTHISSTNTCDACHAVGPTPWAPAQSVDHGHVIGTCASCHNGTTATGKPVTHPPTTDVCDVCHNVPPATWLPFISPLDHSQVIGACVDCHNGAIATGKSGNHPLTTDLCQNCHSTPPAGTWLPYLSPLDHSQVLGSCASCHNGTTATGKPGNHPNTTNNCELCHNVPPLNWLPVITPLDHTQVIGSCVSCHNGTTATGKNAGHPNTTDTCDACHGVPPTPWTSIAISHGDALGLCTECHGAGIAQGKPPGHCEPAGECSDCHLTSGWLAGNPPDCAPPPPPPGVPPPPPVVPPPPPVVPPPPPGVPPPPPVVPPPPPGLPPPPPVIPPPPPVVPPPPPVVPPPPPPPGGGMGGMGGTPPPPPPPPPPVVPPPPPPPGGGMGGM